MQRTLFLLALFGFTPFIQAVTFTVTTTADSGVGSLRQAIMDANATPGGGSIQFGATGTITLASALPTITGSVTIIGPGTNLLTVSGNGLVPIFAVSGGTNHSMISGLTIANGSATGYANGAGVFSAGTLTIANCAFTDNQTSGGWGGAVFNSGTLSVINSIFSGNQVTGENGSGGAVGGGGGAGLGGAVFTMSGNAVLMDCAFIGNAATGGNGGNAGTSGTGRGGGANGGQPGTINNHNGQAGGYGGGGGAGVYTDGNGGTGGYGAGGGGAAECGVGGGSVFGGGSGGRQFSVGYCYFGGGGGGAGLGGGVFVDSGTVTIVNCTFSGNQVTGGSGGAANQTGPGTDGSGIGADFFNRSGAILPVLTASTPGGGTVTMDPANPPYLNNSQATVTAVPASGWTFLNWLGDASDTNPIVSVNVTRNKCVQAVFGTQFSTPALISVNPQADFYPYGTVVKVTALPPAGTYFASWSGAVTGTNNPVTFAVTNANQSISAQFNTLSAGQFALTVIEDGGGHVEINQLTSTYNDGQSATLTTVPDAGQEFVDWSGDVTGTNNPLVVTMSSSKSITANFTQRPSLRVGTCLEGLVEDGFRLTLVGEFGQEYVILGSTNLLDWLAAGTVTNVYGTSLFTDPAGTNLPERFYRARNPLPVFAAVIAARQDIDCKGNGFMSDSFDSSDPLHSTNGFYYGPWRKAGGDVASQAQGLINVNGGNIYGHLRTGALALPPGFFVGDLNWTGPGVQPGWWQNNFRFWFPDVTPPYPVGGSQSVTYFAATNSFLIGSGNYGINGDLSIKSGQTLYVSGVASLYVTGNILMQSGSGSSIIIAPGAQLIVYVGTTSGSPVSATFTTVNTVGNAQSFQFYGLPSCTAMSWTGNSTYVGTVYCPEATFTLGGGGNNNYDYQGACVAQSVKMNGHFNFHFDENLGRNGPVR